MSAPKTQTDRPSSLLRRAVSATPAAPPADDPSPDLTPEWYPKTVRRRRSLLIQSAAGGLIVVVLGVILVLRAGREQAGRRELLTVDAHRARASATLGELSAEERRLSELVRRAQTTGRIGLPVEVSRVLAAVARAVPAGTTLTSLRAETTSDDPPAARGREGGGASSARRSMGFRLRGVAPDAAAVAAVLEGLQAQPVFGGCRVTYGRHADGPRGPEVEFEVTFAVDLNLIADGGGTP